MNIVENLLKSIDENLKRDSLMPYQLSSCGHQLFLLRDIHEQSDNKSVVDLMALFHQAVIKNQMEDLAVRQINYAIKLSDSAGNLEYEEMHKLFSLCDEVYSLQKLGLIAPPRIINDFENSVRKRIQLEKKKAKMVAEDKIEPWKKILWWYHESIQ